MSVRSRGAELRARWAFRVVAVEAIVLVHLTAALQKWVPMRRWSRLLGRPAAVPETWRGRVVEGLAAGWSDRGERRVARAVATAVRVLPWEPSCLAQAAAAQILLRQQGRSGVVVIGLRPGGDGSPTGSPWSAHAWFVGRQGALTGGPAAEGFTATTVFEVPGGLTAEEVVMPRQADGTR